MRFNVNHEVRVKLTDTGRRIHRASHDDLMAFLGSRDGNGWDYTPPKEDADGWSKWQLWSLMAAFGAHMHNGCQVPFETEIDILVEQNKST